MWDLAIWGASAVAVAATSNGSVPTSQTRLEVCSSSSGHATAAEFAGFALLLPLAEYAMTEAAVAPFLSRARLLGLPYSLLLLLRRANQCWWDRKTQMKISEQESERGTAGQSEKGERKEEIKKRRRGERERESHRGGWVDIGRQRKREREAGRQEEVIRRFGWRANRI